MRHKQDSANFWTGALISISGQNIHLCLFSHCPIDHFPPEVDTYRGVSVQVLPTFKVLLSRCFTLMPWPGKIFDILTPVYLGGSRQISADLSRSRQILTKSRQILANLGQISADPADPADPSRFRQILADPSRFQQISTNLDCSIPTYIPHLPRFAGIKPG